MEAVITEDTRSEAFRELMKMAGGACPPPHVRPGLPELCLLVVRTGLRVRGGGGQWDKPSPEQTPSPTSTRLGVYAAERRESESKVRCERVKQKDLYTLPQSGSGMEEH